MGFDTIIVAFFVIGTIVFVACTVTMGANNLVKTSYEGFTASSQTTMDKLHTNIKLDNAVFNVTDDRIHITVENTGETKLTNFDLWDVIVVKNDQASYLENDDFNLTFNDFINPGILDPRESIDIQLPSEFNLEDEFYIKIITENGISSSLHYPTS